ncbi:CBY1-interacting BAR domain-containing protein 1-like [Acanthopagrus schlegelii]
MQTTEQRSCGESNRTDMNSFLSSRDVQVKSMEQTVKHAEKYLGEICSLLASYTRKTAKLRDKADLLVAQLFDFSRTEDPEVQTGLRNLAEDLAMVQDYRQAQVERLETRVVSPLKSYGDVVKSKRADLKKFNTDLNRELKELQKVEKIRLRNPADRQSIGGSREIWLQVLWVCSNTDWGSCGPQAVLGVLSASAGMSSLAPGISSPGAGVSSPGAGISSPAPGISSPAPGISSPGAGVSSPGAGVSSPGVGISSTVPGISSPGAGLGPALEAVTVDSPSNSEAEVNAQKASNNAQRSIRQLEETITDFQRQKLEDIKRIFTDFITVEMLFHAKALEVYTHTYDNLEAMNTQKDLELFNGRIQMSDSVSGHLDTPLSSYSSPLMSHYPNPHLASTKSQGLHSMLGSTTSQNHRQQSQHLATTRRSRSTFQRQRGMEEEEEELEGEGEDEEEDEELEEEEMYESEIEEGQHASRQSYAAQYAEMRRWQK